MTLYLAGPMAGIPDFNYPAFTKASASLRSRGHFVVSPHELSPMDAPREACMRKDIHALLGCEAIAVLPGWQTSRGAILEIEIGRQCGLPIYDATTMLPLEPNA